MKKELTKEEKEKKEELLSQVSATMINLIPEFMTDINKDNFPWNDDLIDLFDGEKHRVGAYSRSLHDYFDIEQIYPIFEEFSTFDTLNELYSYLTYLVLEKHGLLMKGEKMR